MGVIQRKTFVYVLIQEETMKVRTMLYLPAGLRAAQENKQVSMHGIYKAL